ncbi:hypothetical protein BDN70DRAFT_28131 [Pholiota conissans]|uniref:Secreted protein n=1 Tax=Pholiota conissans TaxID=109636 RepID=A0A9P6CZ91_9AGAR|nr:hypothetical protein BDN70DRAFT_28131 [Pholiota conissans]
MFTIFIGLFVMYVSALCTCRLDGVFYIDCWFLFRFYYSRQVSGIPRIQCRKFCWHSPSRFRDPIRHTILSSLRVLFIPTDSHPHSRCAEPLMGMDLLHTSARD